MDVGLRVDALIFKLKDADPTVRETSINKMIALGTPAVEPLLEYLHHKDPWARLMAAGALGKIGDQRAIGPLKELLSDNDDGVRYIAKIALGELIGR